MEEAVLVRSAVAQMVVVEEGTAGSLVVAGTVEEPVGVGIEVLAAVEAEVALVGSRSAGRRGVLQDWGAVEAADSAAVEAVAVVELVQRAAGEVLAELAWGGLLMQPEYC